MKSILLTGATGFLGREMLLHLGDNEPDTKLTLLVRGKDDEDARRRGDKLVSEVFGARASAMRDRVQTVRGDIEKDRLGLEPKAWDRLAKETGEIIHGAASVSFSLPLEEARNVNLGGTRRILDLAKEAGARLDYVGTAYVAGERRGVAKESELDVGQAFRNTYEQTKMESEKLVRSRMGEQPIAIYRPSIIVGDSKTGRTASFKVLYWPLKLYAQGFAKIAPGRRSTPVDVVPSDYVVEAIASIRKRADSIGQTYHLAAGTERDSTIGELTDLASKFFHVRKPLFVDPKYFIDWIRPLIDRFAWGKFKHRMVTARVYTPYLNLDLRYDTGNARSALKGTGIEVPAVADYFQTLFDYCLTTDWGKKLEAA
ncbi:MAG: SDR family oxidoreductase [Polyangiales bacterium]